MAAMKFGRFGREDSSLVLVTRGGTLHIKILKRTAHFENLEMASGPLLGPATRLNVPKRTKLFVDQTLRERENAVLMHRYRWVDRGYSAGTVGKIMENSKGSLYIYCIYSVLASPLCASFAPCAKWRMVN